MLNQFNLKHIIPSMITLIFGILLWIVIPSQINIPQFIGTGGETVWNARTLPKIITFSIIGLSLLDIFLYLLKSITTKKTEEKSEELEVKSLTEIQSKNYAGVLISATSIFLWTLLIPYIGFSLATFFLVIVLMRVFENRSWLNFILLALILSFLLDFLLKTSLRVYFPSGGFFELIINKVSRN